MIHGCCARAEHSPLVLPLVLFFSLLCVPWILRYVHCFFFFFNDTATTEIYTLSLHDALPISPFVCLGEQHSVDVDGRHFAMGVPHQDDIDTGNLFSYCECAVFVWHLPGKRFPGSDRKSTRLNSSHLVISYAVFCLKKKKHTHH